VAHLHARAPSAPPAPPSGLVAQRGEWFLPGTQVRAGSAAATGDAQAFGIQTPRDGSLVLLDPDIPLQAQRLAFVGAPGQWRVNGRVVGSGSVVHWLPRPGRHVLERRIGGPRGLRSAGGSATGTARTGRLSRRQMACGLNKRSTATSMTMPHRLYSSEPISAAVKLST
jgi:penicillin-binding protein 1C